MQITKLGVASVSIIIILSITSSVLAIKMNDMRAEVMENKEAAAKNKAEAINNRKAMEMLAIEYVKLDAKCRYEKEWRRDVAEKAEDNGVMLPMPPLVKTGD